MCITAIAKNTLTCFESNLGCKGAGSINFISIIKNANFKF